MVAIKWGKEKVTGHFVGSGARGVLLAHGAGTNQDHPTIVGTRDALAAEGLTVLTFNYLYTEAGRTRPDSKERLLECHRAALASLAERVGDGVVLAGRSMGGRMGTYLGAEGALVLGVVSYAYPLHPPGQPDKLRVEHLPEIKIPMLFFQGSSDPLSRSDLFDRYVRSLPKAEVEDMEANHSLGGVKSVGYLAHRTAGWIRALLPSTGS